MDRNYTMMMTENRRKYSLCRISKNRVHSIFMKSILRSDGNDNRKEISNDCCWKE